MDVLDKAVAYLLAPKDNMFWVLVIALGIGACAVFAFNTLQNRDPINLALRKSSEVSVKELQIPERMFGYDAKYLDTFIAITSQGRLGSGETVLQRYTSPTLLWWDVLFAVLLSGFGAMIAIGITPFLPWHPYSIYAALLSAIMSILYGVADTLENWRLASILERGSPVESSEATAASCLTVIKLVTIALSIVDVIAFYAFQLIVLGIRYVIK